MKRLPLLVTAVADDDLRQAAGFYVAEGSTADAIAFVEAVERTFLHVLHAARDIPEHLQAPE
ncbi:MAG: hypothetical protein Q8N53_12995 [Longimicrobiales bacterium]|nr:hypothetical protein [Longimicrobiales bacterium]